ITGVQLHRVTCVALKLPRVLEDHDALRRIADRHDLAYEGIRKRGLPRRGAAGDQDVPALADTIDQNALLRWRQDPSLDVVVEAVDLARALADDKGGRGGDGRQDSLEAIAVDR